jgi:enoyl-[acyl-carrier protein] reductase I
MDSNIGKLLQGKRGLITGIANSSSIAWSVAQLARAHGADLAFTYQGDMLEKRIMPLAQEVGCDLVIKCDVTDESSIKSLFSTLESKWGKLDFILHSIAFSDKNELKGRYIDTTLNNFLNSMHISCYSLTSFAKYAEPLMVDGGSILTLTYHGAQKVVPYYNVMGVAKAALECSVRYIAHDLGHKNIRVNAISAGPIRTLAASVIGDFRSMLDMHQKISPLRKNVTQEDVASSALYLLSGMSRAVTGEIHYVDCGYNIMTVDTSILNPS